MIRIARLAAVAVLVPSAWSAASGGDESFVSAVARASAGRPALRPPVDREAQLPLEEALVLALRNNLDIDLARIEPALAEQETVEARGAFDPRFSLGFSLDRDEDAQIASSEREGWSYTGGIAGVLPGGLRYSSRYQKAETQGEQARIALSEIAESRWVSELTLPLLRDAGLNEARVRVVRTEVGAELSEDAFALRLSELVAGVERLYWEASATRIEVERAEQSLQTARDLEVQTRELAEAGVVARVQVLEAEVGVSERERDRVRARIEAETARDELLGALFAPSADVYADRELIPELPRFAPRAIDLDAAVARAMRLHPELVSAHRRVEAAQVEEELAVNQLRPRLDLVAGYTVRDQSARSERDCGPDCEARFGDRGARLALSDGRGEGFRIGAQIEVTLGNRGARAARSQRSIELRRAKLALRKLEQQVIRSVREAARRLEGAAQAVQSAARRHQAARALLEAERERLALGESTPFDVLESDERVAEAQREWIFALRDHRNAITDFESAQGSLLEARGIRLDEQL